MISRSWLSVLPFIHSALGQSSLGLPFNTSGRDILYADGSVFPGYAGTNWPGHQQAMVPEGLQYSSIEDVVSKIKAFGLNAVRVTFAIEMLDDIIDNGGDKTLQETFEIALGAGNGSLVLEDVLANNPQFNATTTRLQVFDEVAAEFGRQEIYLHLDNHMSGASWCCGDADGNTWWGDEQFDADKWIRGWGYIAGHAAANWPTFASVGLRNELRGPPNGVGEPYDWYTWYERMTAAADAVHEAAPDALIFFSGLDYDTHMSEIPLGMELTGTDGTSTEGKSATFIPSDFPYEKKIALELHKYDFEETQASCEEFISGFYNSGFQALDPDNEETVYPFPVAITEYGFIQDGEYYNSTTYNECMIQFVETYKAGFFQWDVAGSYYIQTKDGATIQDKDEEWGLLNHDWSDTRSQVTVDNSLLKMVDALLS
ncbi:hypothetical protein FQN54_007849 [Arachnomyces sp. PD_36]|nr:hypothetical protein FQN54_007849 [Arachnomyces sp. PD_36]